MRVLYVQQASHLGQLATATPLGQTTCGYQMLMLNFTDQFLTIHSFLIELGYKLGQWKRNGLLSTGRNLSTNLPVKLAKVGNSTMLASLLNASQPPHVEINNTDCCFGDEANASPASMESKPATICCNQPCQPDSTNVLSSQASVSLTKQHISHFLLNLNSGLLRHQL